MKEKIYCTILIFVLTLFVACNHNERLDSIQDYELIRAMKSAQKRNDKDIDIEALENYIRIYEKKNEKGKLCWCNALIGYKSYAKRDYDKSMIHLKRA